MATLRNLPQDMPKLLAELISPKKNQIISMALAQSEHLQITLLTFADNENVSEEEYFGDTMYYIVEGEAIITQGENVHHLKAGDVFMVPAHVLHEIAAKGAFKVLQITVNE
ncbi:Mannose-6-phosphate isomerase, cupin superfamily [Desulfonispora thiosulfatigenes DSM 11270]|uniref:Mannose-6-phosphate isomerase, cupin superfamily n=1 Tax=Desulfonispora thiosulfatigenes DSM 11270 TaxID=656914 RepID=A0A1W1UV77_DESTI|nr:cupin domain-containing protein [Desulfonispora thiosulfatigenes]SMB85068.1 Mannose-6-phosphate isomerase, cupin superfamily [Desulfonispora thiosulfatigenes DSM 11270]